MIKVVTNPLESGHNSVLSSSFLVQVGGWSKKIFLLRVNFLYGIFTLEPGLDPRLLSDERIKCRTRTLSETEEGHVNY